MNLFKTFGRRLLWAGIGALAVTLGAASAQAQFPERPITIVVPWGAGGGADFHGRTLGALMEERLGVPVNVVNRTGGNGVVGHSAIATADPDGHTLGIITVEVAMMHHQGLTEITNKDYDILGVLNFISPGVQVRADDDRFETANDLVQYIRDNPGEIKGSGSPIGAIWHVAFLGMLSKVGIGADAITWIPSQGGAPGLQELVSGGVDVAPVNIGEAGALIQSGRVRSLVLMSDSRNETFPDVPTLEEALGVTGAPQALVGIAAPAGLPDDIRTTLIEVVDELTSSDAWEEAMVNRGFPRSQSMTAAEFSAFLDDLDVLMGNVLADAGLLAQ